MLRIGLLQGLHNILQRSDLLCTLRNNIKNKTWPYTLDAYNFERDKMSIQASRLQSRAKMMLRVL